MKDNPVIFSLEPLYFGDEIEQRIRSNHWIIFVGKFYGTLSVEKMEKKSLKNLVIVDYRFIRIRKKGSSMISHRC